MSTVRQVIEHLTDTSLDEHTEPVEGPGWRYAERDLDARAENQPARDADR